MAQPADNAKAELNRHINSKLFQKFLSKEAAKISDSQPKAVPRRSPYRNRESSQNEERARSQSRSLNKTFSNRGSLKTLREISPVQVRNSPIRIEQMQELDISDVRRSHYDSPEANRVTWKANEEVKSFIPVYTADPLLLKQLENDKKALKEELLKTQDRFELQLRKKNEEVKRMQKQNEHLKVINEELLGKLDLAEETERKFASSKAERDAQERKIHALEGECDNYKRQIEHLKEACENYKTQIDDYERSSRNKCQDVERELRIAKDRIEDLERQVVREKERQQDTERKLNKSKEKVFSAENEIARVQEKNGKLERDLQEAKDRISHEAGMQIRETEGLRRKIEDLTQEILRRERNEEFRKKMYSPPREDFYATARERPTRDVDEGTRKREFAESSKFYPEMRREEGTNDLRRRDSRDVRDVRDGRDVRDVRDVREQKDLRDNRDTRQDILTWQKKEASPRLENVKGLEVKLMNLQMDKKKLEDELSKIPASGKRIAQIKRQEEIELELDILNSNINTLRNKLRQAGAL